jgi:glycosyltransferase involved in cell wall biosynthesis
MRPDQPDVLLVAPYPPAGERHGGHSGVASYTANLAGALAAEGARVEVLAPTLDDPTATSKEPDEFRDGDVTVRRRYRLGAGALPHAASIAASHPAGVVHLQWETFLYGGAPALPGLFPALFEMRRAQQPFVTTMHQVLDPATVDRRTTALHRIGLPAPVARLGIGLVQRAIAAASDATIVHERAFRRIVPDATVIAHGIELPTRLDRRRARQRLGLDDRFVAISFGFLAPYKGLELVAEAAAHVGPGVEIVLAGGAHPRLTQSTTADYGEQLQRIGGDRLRCTGWVPDEHVSAWFAAADVALFPYPKPFAASGALALALSHGTPVLLSPPLARCVGAPSTLVAEMQPEALARQLDDLAAGRAHLDEHADWSEVLADERRWPAVARRHLDLYGEVGYGGDPAPGRLRAA